MSTACPPLKNYKEPTIMKIYFENFKANSYMQGEDETYGVFFRSTDKNANLSPTIINLYNTHEDTVNDEKLYLELANATTPDTALKFTNKYGKLIETDILKEVYTIIETQNYNSTQSPKYDYVLYNHFCYYQQTIHNLIDIYNLLQKDNYTLDEIELLFTLSCQLICNEYYEDRFYLEFSNYYDIEETISSLSEYPLMQLIYKLVINKDKAPKISHDDALMLTLKFFHNIKDISAFFSSLDDQDAFHDLMVNYPFEEYLREVHEKMSIPYTVPLEDPNTPPIQFFIKTLDFAKKEKLPSDYLINHKTDFKNLAYFVFSQILMFEIRFTHPAIDLKLLDDISCWQFNSLSNAIFFNYYIDIFYGTTFKVCKNEYCKKLFAYSPSKPTQEYCCYNCAHKATNRKYKKEHK